MIIPTDTKIAELCQYYHNEAVRLFVKADSDLKIDKRLTNHLAVICANIYFNLHDVKQSKFGLISKTIKIFKVRKSHLRVAKNMMAGAFDEKSDLTEKRRLRHAAELNYSIARKLTPFNHTQFVFDFIFKVFRKNADRPGACWF